METMTCQICGAAAMVGADRSITPNRAEMEARCKHWPPVNQQGFAGALITGCEHLDQAVRMAAAFARRPPRPIS
jgi:hypothetical protein